MPDPKQKLNSFQELESRIQAQLDEIRAHVGLPPKPLTTAADDPPPQVPPNQT